mmetsp:Transcript_10618/g.25168  ORF Transcript_10618/g.25168 Transcript_10618/m.25168 type:complete len:217 (+) Transcript_10618:822-1472(+)
MAYASATASSSLDTCRMTDSSVENVGLASGLALPLWPTMLAMWWEPKAPAAPPNAACDSPGAMPTIGTEPSEAGGIHPPSEACMEPAGSMPWGKNAAAAAAAAAAEPVFVRRNLLLRCATPASSASLGPAETGGQPTPGGCMPGAWQRSCRLAANPPIGSCGPCEAGGDDGGFTPWAPLAIAGTTLPEPTRTQGAWNPAGAVARRFPRSLSLRSRR